MLDYEWGNPSTIMISGDEPTTDSDQTRQMFDHYTQVFNETQINPNGFAPNPPHFHQIHPHTQTQTHSTHFHSLYDPPAFNGSYPTPSPVMLSLESFGGSSSGPSGFMVMPKTEPGSGVVDFTTRIGLDLGGRTYFSSEDDDFVNRLYRRSRMVHPGSFNSPRCQAEGCNADLTHAKHYHRRHKVCEFHSKAAAVIAAGLTQRFCQQCSRFHLLSEFDNGKRSCRKRLADHNRRRRKSSQQSNQEQPNKPQLENAQSPPSDSGAPSSSSVTIAISPPRMRSSLFFSNG